LKERWKERIQEEDQGQCLPDHLMTKNGNRRYVLSCVADVMLGLLLIVLCGGLSAIVIDIIIIIIIIIIMAQRREVRRRWITEPAQGQSAQRRRGCSCLSAV